MQNILIPNAEAFDHIASQFIERYREMTPTAAHKAIAAEWKEQMAAVFEAFMFMATGSHARGMTKLIEVARKNGCGSYFVPGCHHLWGGWRQK